MARLLHSVVFAVLLCAGGDAFAGAFQFSDGTRSFVAPAGDCYTVGQGYMGQVQGSLGNAYSVVLAGCSTDTDGNVTGVAWDVWNVASGAHVGTYSATLTQTTAFADVPGAPFVTADFSFVFATVFVSTMSLYLVAFAIGLVIKSVRDA